MYFIAFFCRGNQRVCYFGPTVSEGATNSHLEQRSDDYGLTMDEVRGSYFEIHDRFYQPSNQSR